MPETVEKDAPKKVNNFQVAVERKKKEAEDKAEQERLAALHAAEDEATEEELTRGKEIKVPKEAIAALLQRDVEARAEAEDHQFVGVDRGTEEEPEFHEWRWVLNADTQDYEHKLVDIRTLKSLAYDQTKGFRDDFFIDEAARNRGRWGAMDFRLESEDNEVSMRNAIQNGFVPVKELLDSRFRMEGGRMMFGDLQVMFRPKEVTAQRAKQLATISDRMMGEPEKEWLEQGEVDPQYAVPFGQIKIAQGDGGRAVASEDVQFATNQLDETDVKRASRNASVHAIHNPLGEDKVAKNHRPAAQLVPTRQDAVYMKDGQRVVMGRDRASERLGAVGG